MFGDEFAGDPTRIIRVCCGPRCASETEHRKIYLAVESTLAERNRILPDDAIAIRPAMCQGYCGMGVTVVTASIDWMKIRAASEVREKLLTLENNETCPQ